MERPLTCTDVRGDLPLFVGADLKVPALEAMAQHLESCGACREELAGLDRARGVLRSLKEASGPSIDPWPALRAELATEGHIASPSTPASGSLRPWAAAAAALLLLAGGVWVGARLTGSGTSGPRESGVAGALVPQSPSAPSPSRAGQPALASGSRALRPVDGGARLADSAVSFGEEGAVAGRGALDPAASLTGGASAASSTGQFVLPPRIR
jgi:hypothetical protein